MTCVEHVLLVLRWVFGMTSSSQNLQKESDVKIALRFHGACFCAFRLGGECADGPAASPRRSARCGGQGIAQRSVRRDEVARWHKQNVYDPTDAKIGAVEDVLVDRDGKIVAFIVAVGGFLGMGEKDVAVPFNAVQFKAKDNNKWYPVMNTTKDALKNAPGHKYDRNAMTWTVENAPTTTGTPATPSPQPSAR